MLTEPIPEAGLFGEQLDPRQRQDPLSEQLGRAAAIGGPANPGPVAGKRHPDLGPPSQVGQTLQGSGGQTGAANVFPGCVLFSVVHSRRPFARLCLTGQQVCPAAKPGSASGPPHISAHIFRPEPLRFGRRRGRRRRDSWPWRIVRKPPDDP